MVPWGSVRVASCSRTRHRNFFYFSWGKFESETWNFNWMLKTESHFSRHKWRTSFPPQSYLSTSTPYTEHVGICETLTTYVSVRPSVIQKIFIRVSSPLVRHKVSYNRDTKITVIHINTTDNYMLHAKSLQHIRQTKKKCILKITLQRWVSVLNHFLLYNKNKSQHDESWSRVNCNSPKLTTRASQKPETWAVSLLTVTKIGAG